MEKLSRVSPPSHSLSGRWVPMRRWIRAVRALRAKESTFAKTGHLAGMPLTFSPA